MLLVASLARAADRLDEIFTQARAITLYVLLAVSTTIYVVYKLLPMLLGGRSSVVRDMAGYGMQALGYVYSVLLVAGLIGLVRSVSARSVTNR